MIIYLNGLYKAINESEGFLCLQGQYEYQKSDPYGVAQINIIDFYKHTIPSGLKKQKIICDMKIYFLKKIKIEFKNDYLFEWIV